MLIQMAERLTVKFVLNEGQFLRLHRALSDEATIAEAEWMAVHGAAQAVNCLTRNGKI